MISSILANEKKPKQTQTKVNKLVLFYCASQGDSGGPLLCRDPNDKERWFVGGIVSWGVKCAHPQLPGVYANVPQYVPWILQQMQRFNNDNEEEHQHHEYGIRRDFDSGYRGHR